MLVAGLAFLLFWALVELFTVTVLHAALATAVVFVALGLLLGERPPKP